MPDENENDTPPEIENLEPEQGPDTEPMPPALPDVEEHQGEAQHDYADDPPSALPDPDEHRDAT